MSLPDFNVPAIGSAYAVYINDGYSARLFGREQNTCPWAAGTIERAAWLHGYAQACDHVHAAA